MRQEVAMLFAFKTWNEIKASQKDGVENKSENVNFDAFWAAALNKAVNESQKDFSLFSFID